jgi:hypothetical protein
MISFINNAQCPMRKAQCSMNAQLPQSAMLNVQRSTSAFAQREMLNASFHYRAMELPFAIEPCILTIGYSALGIEY